jgi:hypothetical protein
MKKYESYVRTQPNGMVFKTMVMAENTQAAYFLLQSLYGKDNVIHLPQEVQ